ncbi:immunity 49 family protein [Nocardiopsis sp. NPDC058631]|uniref:immunity 49 family protein n=1 Tax=Nocardiopsis sp. NPDC058631 TaxID=3346566 RepID=UPI003646545C
MSTENRNELSLILESNPESIDFALSTLHMDVMFSTAADPEVSRLETWEAWTADMQMHHALFTVQTNQQGIDLELMVNHEIRRTRATGPKTSTNASNWTTAFFLAVICRDQKRYRELCEIPVDLLRASGERRGTRYNPFTYHWISALQAFVLNRPGLGEELLAAMELSTPDQVDFGDTESLDKLVFPPMNTFLRLVERDSDKFNEALAQGLALHGDYYTANAERSHTIMGAVPLSLLAMACLAYDTAEVAPDFRLEVESGYLPKHLVQRSWYGEFPVLEPDT